MAHAKENPVDANVCELLNSLCKKYGLDRKKYDYPDYSPAQGRKIEAGFFDKLLVATSNEAGGIPLNRLIYDTTKVYYVDYWASWCGPCIKGLPNTVALSNAKIKNREVLFLNVENNRNNFVVATKRYGLPAMQTFNVVPGESNEPYYKRLNPIDHIPVYQLIFFNKGYWYVLNAPAAGPLLRTQFEGVLQVLKSDN